MAAHAARTAPTQPLPAPTRHAIRRAFRRSATLLAIVAAVILTFGNVGALAAASHAVCTYGTPAGTTCGEALYLLGFPV